MRDVLREAAQICKDLDEEALAKAGRKLGKSMEQKA